MSRKNAAEKRPDIKVVAGPGAEPMAHEIIEQAIIDIAAGLKRINQSRIKRNVIVLLLQDATKLGKRDIEYVLNSMEQLEELYLKPRKTP